ncbi:collagen alpha-1(XII) chain-like, partial [Actinia tenebrosa]|uniref:Collagen alpha-1(XII) chain-like n=1 Tax=Actinia tenebrosa TaxID=6105 RepID=A0A6P8HXK1_ACTTE
MQVFGRALSAAEIRMRMKTCFRPVPPVPPKPTRPPPTASPKVCNRRIDLGFLIDVSSRVGRTNIKYIRLYVKEMVRRFRVTSRLTRVGIVTYSSRQRRIIRLTRARSNRDVNRALGRIQIRRGRRRTGSGLRYAKRYLFEGKPKCGRKRVLIVLTTGASADGVRRPAKSLENIGVEIFVVVPNKGGRKQMHQIATSRLHVVTMAYARLINIVA